jgi:hypothetical protein
MDASILLKTFKLNKPGFDPLTRYAAGPALRIEHNPSA